MMTTKANIKKQMPKIMRRKNGFTIIELVVVVGILVVITGVVLANHSRFGEKILLRNLAYDVALSIRQAQVFGISAKRGTGATPAFATGHGIYFNVAELSQFKSFFDLNKDNLYSGSAEWTETTILSRAYRIERICVGSGDIRNCNVSELHIVFRRPEPDAIITAKIYEEFQSGRTPAEITLHSPRGDSLSVLVETSGQVSVAKKSE